MKPLMPLALAVALGLSLYVWLPAWTTVGAWALLLLTCLYLDIRQRRADDVEALEAAIMERIAAGDQRASEAEKQRAQQQAVADERHAKLAEQLKSIEQRLEALMHKPSREPRL